MNCTQVDQYLDDMMDQTLEAKALEDVEKHCEGCAACAEKLKINRQMMRMFAEMAPEIEVPLKTQAAWRASVKREADRKRRRRFYRYAGGIAAALVVAIGATLALRMPAGDNAKYMNAETTRAYTDSAQEAYEDSADAEEAAPMAEAMVAPMAAANADADMAEEYTASEEALIEADGAVYESDFTVKALGAPMHAIEVVVDDVDRACEYAQDLALEYEGTIDIQRYEEDGVPCANLYVDLPPGNAQEYVEAIWQYDVSDVSLEPLEPGDGGTMSIMLVFKSK